VPSEYDDLDRRAEDESPKPTGSADRARRRVLILAILLTLNGMMGVFIASFFYSLKPETLVKILKRQVAAQPAGPERQENEQRIKDLEEKLKEDPGAYKLELGIFGVLNAIAVIGAYQMWVGKSRGWGMAASIITLIPCITGCFCSGPPIGIWGLILLSSNDVKAVCSTTMTIRQAADEN
jgi:hypothetical protein